MIHFPARPHRWKRRLFFLLPAALLPGIAFAGHVLSDNTPSAPTVILAPPSTDSASAQTKTTVPPTFDPNELIKQKVTTMPIGGSYRANIIAMTALRQSVQLIDSQLAIDPNVARPSFCSGATYLVFLSVRALVLVA